MLDQFELTKKQAEAGDNESKSHQRQARSDPRQERPLCRQEIAQLRLLLLCHAVQVY